MKKILIDTCVIIEIVRDTITGKECLKRLEKFGEDLTIILSIVTKAELDSFSRQNKWGEKKVEKLNLFLSSATIISINENDVLLLDAYSQIDGYSKRKLLDKNGTLRPGSAITMGKNDLWIAATASALNIPLLTNDGDYDHLNGIMIEVIKVSHEKKIDKTK
jgi:tRNA(fMet)-specific endonuclease VapC